ncbi:LemA family protein [Candidatus Bilamarchaeum dharawalense]|uniref:LemA family protein n=1 Tax=Candidatus Bilamarchaeum dharawalense TaxID=2885759 RepID=A0A5E4LTW0_9ARCH|nr:LemA family protein [Candidatus Bilamarchaeum dharawalense]
MEYFSEKHLIIIPLGVYCPAINLKSLILAFIMGELMAFELILAAVCLVGLVIFVLLYVVMIYNRLISLRNRVDNAWAQIDVQLKRRYDLIPNLIETVKGYMKHERGTLETITKYRAQLVTGTAEEKVKANNMLTQALKSVFAVAENYPKLEASENFKMLQEELAGTENKIAYIRTAYNDSVLEYTNSIQMFPSNLIAGILGFQKKPYLEVPEEEKKNVKVQF